ncbi:MAG: hypothetical protein AB8F95_02615 [Bacteroidia bacterium]
MNIILIAISLITISCISQSEVEDDKREVRLVKEITYGEAIPFMLGVHNEHQDKESFKIEFLDNSEKTILIHEGPFEGWGMRWMDTKIRTGEYLLRLSWKEEDGPKLTQRKIFINPDTKSFSLNTELANEPQMEREHNAIYLDQYTSSLSKVDFVRNWDPAQQFAEDTLLLPDYNVTNNNDSTIYGAYLRFSSMLSINWVQPHSIAFMRFEHKTDSGWVSISCNAPRIKMDLESGQQGETFKDMILGCAVKNFETGGLYRVRIDYMINDRVFEKNLEEKGIEDNIYVEQKIYSYTDEFKLGK